MRKGPLLKEKNGGSYDIDSANPEISGTSLEVTISEATIAFHYEKNGMVREFLAHPSGWWLEIQPGDMINDYLANGFFPKLAMAVLEDRVDLKDEEVISQSMSQEFPLWTAPAQVPLRVVPPPGRRSFKRWMTQRGYKWAVERESLKVRLVTRGGRLVKVPNRWRSAFDELVSMARPEWGPAVAYISLPVQQLRWAEAVVLRERGARLRNCRAGHPFVWIGRTTKQWCSWHQRERDALETRYTRASPAKKKSLLADLKRLGLQRGGQGASTIRASRGTSTTGRGTWWDHKRSGKARTLVVPMPEEVEELSGILRPDRDTKGVASE